MRVLGAQGRQSARAAPLSLLRTSFQAAIFAVNWAAFGLIVTQPCLAQSKDAASEVLPWKSQGEGGDSGPSFAKEAAKAARQAAEEAKAAAAEAKAAAANAAASGVKNAAPAGSAAAPAGPATPIVNPTAAATGSIAPPTPAVPAIKPTPATLIPAAKAAATAAPAKIVLTPARELFGAAKIAAPLTARAIGSYAKGCLAGGQALAIDGPAWQAVRLSRNRNWGHPKLIALLERFATEMKTKENWPGLLVGDIAQPRGGPMLTGHKSHQVGLDADIWFKPKPEETLTQAARETLEPLLLAEDNGKDVIAANWNEGFVRLVKRAANYPEVERIFVHPAIKKEFCKAAGTDRSWLLKVRPMWLHNYHFHIRIACPAGSGSCEKQVPPPNTDDGCGKELTDWIAMVSKPPKPEPVPAPKPIPVAPKPEMNLEQLPMECRSVLTAGEPKDAPAFKAIAQIAQAHAAATAQKAAKTAAAKAKAKAKSASTDQ